MQLKTGSVTIIWKGAVYVIRFQNKITHEYLFLIGKQTKKNKFLDHNTYCWNGFLCDNFLQVTMSFSLFPTPFTSGIDTLIFILSYFLANSETKFACTLLLEAFLFSSTSPFRMRNYAKLNSNQCSTVCQDCLPVLIIEMKQSLFQVIKVLWNFKVLVNHFLFQSKLFNTP